MKTRVWTSNFIIFTSTGVSVLVKILIYLAVIFVSIEVADFVTTL